MTEHSLTVRLKIGKWYAKNLLTIEPGFNAHLERWNKENNECTMTITCFDDYPYPQYRKTKEDLESYLIRKFGSMILQDKRKPSNLDTAAACKGIPLTHPVIKQDKKDYPSYADNYQEEYVLNLTKQQLQEANGTLHTLLHTPPHLHTHLHTPLHTLHTQLHTLDDRTTRIKADKIKPTSGYESDIYQLRIGKWH